MKRAIYIALALLLLISLDATAIAQNTQEASDEPCVVQKERCVQTFYDKFQDITIVRTIPLVVYQTRYYGWLTFGAAYLSHGTQTVRPESAIFYFEQAAFSTHETDFFENSRGIYLLVDGKPKSLGDVSLQKFDNSNGVRKWTHAITVPFNILELIASGKSLEMRAGSVEFTFDDNLKAAFSHLIALTPKEAPAPKKEDAPPAKLPTQKSTPRRRRGRP